MSMAWRVAAKSKRFVILANCSRSDCTEMRQWKKMLIWNCTSNDMYFMWSNRASFAVLFARIFICALLSVPAMFRLCTRCTRCLKTSRIRLRKLRSASNVSGDNGSEDQDKDFSRKPTPEEEAGLFCSNRYRFKVQWHPKYQTTKSGYSQGFMEALRNMPEIITEPPPVRLYQFSRERFDKWWNAFQNSQLGRGQFIDTDFPLKL